MAVTLKQLNEKGTASIERMNLRCLSLKNEAALLSFAFGTFGFWNFSLTSKTVQKTQQNQFVMVRGNILKSFLETLFDKGKISTTIFLSFLCFICSWKFVKNAKSKDISFIFYIFTSLSTLLDASFSLMIQLQQSLVVVSSSTLLLSLFLIVQFHLC